MQAMTWQQIMAAFCAVNEQQARVAWRHEAMRRVKDFPKSEDALISATPKAIASVQSPLAQKQIAKMITAHARAVLET